MNYQGYIPSTPDELDRLRGVLKDRQGDYRFSALAGHLAGSGKGKLIMPWKSLKKLDPGAFTEVQGGPDCTTHGSRNAFDTSRAVEIDIKGELESFEARGATEFTYWFRGHRGEGMSPAIASTLHHEHGILIRKKYEFADLTKYSFANAVKFDGKKIPPEVLQECDKHPMRWEAQIDSVEEYIDALANGYGMHCGSGYGFSEDRDEQGVAEVSGGWNHDMAHLAVDDTRELANETRGGIFNSWGKFNRGGWAAGRELVDGAFWVHQKTIEGMIRSGEIWAIGKCDGFPPQQLPDYASYWGS